MAQYGQRLNSDVDCYEGREALDPIRAVMGRRLLELITSKKALVARVQRNVLYRTLMKWWLGLHVSLSIALLAALTIHVITVFFYW